MADLKSRLDRIRRLGLVRATELRVDESEEGRATSGTPDADRGASTARQRAPVASQEIPSGAFVSGGPGPAGWVRSGDYLWKRETRHTLWFPEEIDIAAFEVAQNASARRLARASPAGPRRGRGPILAPDHSKGDGGVLGARAGNGPESRYSPLSIRRAREDLRFFDFETTGLSGGTGTVAFLAAIAQPDVDGCSVSQYFLSDYPGEPAFLEAVLADLPPGCTVVTYNGRCFDIPLLRTRCIMNGMRMGSFGQLDALYLARRLWRRKHGGASLGLLEAKVLEIEREEDVPGALIPGLWLEYLRSGDDRPLRPVFAHNAIDVVSLAGLVARAARVFAAAEPLSRVSGSQEADMAWIGRTLIELGEEAKGEALLESACADGDERAGLMLSARYRRAGREEERRALFELLPVTARSDIERAKFAEHVQKDLRAALAYTERAMTSDVQGLLGETLAARHRRLSEKLSRDRAF